MSANSAITSLRFALQRELLKLYLGVFAGISIVNISQSAFGIIDHALLRQLVELPLLLLGWGLIAGGMVGIVHFVLSETAVQSTGQ